MLVRARVESIDRDSNFPPLSLSLSLFLFFWSILVRIPAEISYRGAEIKWRETFYDESRELEISVMRNETFFREDFLFFFFLCPPSRDFYHDDFNSRMQLFEFLFLE